MITPRPWDRRAAESELPEETASDRQQLRVHNPPPRFLDTPPRPRQDFPALRPALRRTLTAAGIDQKQADAITDAVRHA